MKNWFLVIATVAACSKGGGAGDPAKCAEVTGAAVDRMMGGAGGMGRPMPEEMKASMKERGDKLKGVIAKHCVDDKWSAEVLDCYAKAGSMPDIKACRMKLPEAQAQSLQADEMGVMMAGAGMMRPHASLEQLQKKMADLDAQVTAVQDELTNAKDDAARTAAKEKLVQVQRQQFALRQELQALSGAAAGSAAPAAGSAAAAAGSAAPGRAAAAAPAGSAAP